MSLRCGAECADAGVGTISKPLGHAAFTEPMPSTRRAPSRKRAGFSRANP